MSNSPSSAIVPRDPDRIRALASFVERHARVFVLTGAGVSTSSGIPDYRDLDGSWKRRPPVQYGPFVREKPVRRRYWARSALGWPGFARSRPGAAHDALARLQRAGHVHALVTQNVDRLHQRAGSRCAVDLHGRLDRVICLGCGLTLLRDAVQKQLLAMNEEFEGRTIAPRPDGDSDLPDTEISRVRYPDCSQCGGVLMPDVVFFGGSVPPERVQRCREAIEAADALLVVGSSLQVYSGFRFCRHAQRIGKPIGIINPGETRADPMASLRLNSEAAPLLSAVLAADLVEELP